MAMDKIKHGQRPQIAKFVREHLRRDGCFIVRLVAKNSSDLIASELICGLWDNYIDQGKINDSNAKQRMLEESTMSRDELPRY